MREFITSDIHFGHKNIMNFCPETRARFNHNVEYMNSKIVLEWNEIIQPEDHTYILGDVAFCSHLTAARLLNQCNGTKTLIVGNHDTKLIKQKEFMDCFIEITPYKHITHIMTHHSKMHEDCRELFAFEKDNRIPADVMYKALVTTLKNAWVEHLI